jgi:hypothetical protein
MYFSRIWKLTYLYQTFDHMAITSSTSWGKRQGYSFIEYWYWMMLKSRTKGSYIIPLDSAYVTKYNGEVGSFGAEAGGDEEESKLSPPRLALFLLP